MAGQERRNRGRAGNRGGRRGVVVGGVQIERGGSHRRVEGQLPRGVGGGHGHGHHRALAEQHGAEAADQHAAIERVGARPENADKARARRKHVGQHDRRGGVQAVVGHADLVGDRSAKSHRVRRVRHRHEQICARRDRGGRTNDEAPAAGDEAGVGRIVIVHVERPDAVGIGAPERGQCRVVGPEAGASGVRRYRVGERRVVGRAVQTAAQAAELGNSRSRRVIERHRDAVHRDIRAGVGHEHHRRPGRSHQQDVEVGRIGMSQSVQRDGDLVDRSQDAGHDQRGRIRRGRRVVVDGDQVRVLEGDDQAAEDKLIRHPTEEHPIVRDGQRGHDVCAIRAAGGEGERARHGTAAGDQRSVVLGLRVGMVDAVPINDGGSDVARVHRAAVAQGEEHRHGFTRIDDVVRGHQALAEKHGPGRDDDARVIVHNGKGDRRRSAQRADAAGVEQG